MMRTRNPASLALLILTLLALAAPVDAQADNEAVLELLRNTVVTVDYDGKDFDEIIEELRQTHHLNIHVSWKHLEERKVRRDQRLEINLVNVPLSTLLRTILREVQPTEFDELAYQVENGIVVVSTREALSQTTLLRAYNVTDFFESGYADRRFFTTPSLSLATTGNEAVGGENVRRQPAGTGGGGGGGFGGGASGNPYEHGGEPPLRISDMERIEEMIDMLVTMVTPDEWEDNGGLTASVRYYKGHLYIRHTINGHDDVERFIEALREGRPQPLDATAWIVRVRTDRARAWTETAGPGFPRVAAEKLDAFIDAAGAQGILFNGTTSGVNGKRLWFSALTQRDLLTGISSVAGADVVAYVPRTGFSTEGLELIALPLVTPGTDQLQLDVNLAWIPDAQIEQRAVRLGPDAGDATVDHLTRRMRTVSTATHMHLGDAIALSIPHELPDAGIAPEYEDWLIVHIQAVDR